MIEPERDDASSISGSSVEDSLASLRSSIMDYRRENGRTYHRMSDGKYVLPNDEQEQDRLDLVHHLWTLTWDGDICISPKKDGAKRVLDIGTGTGIWALDYADAHPEATVLGVDLSPIQPSYVPPNCSFEVDDVEKVWTWTRPFDYVMCRSMLACFTDWEDIIAKAYAHLEPGGYLELQEQSFPVKCDDGTMTKDSKYFQWADWLVKGADKMGRPITCPPRYKKMLEDAGFVDVVEVKKKWPINGWPKDPHLKELGFWAQASATQGGIEAAALALFTRVLDWSPEETRVFCAEVRNEVKKLGVHGYFEVYGVYGRKPEKEASEPAQPPQPPQ